jgi:hypothetical protein
MILHAKQRWPDAVTPNLWPFAVRMANELLVAAPRLDNNHVSPLELFVQTTERSPRAKHSHTFGSLVYVLDARAQQGRQILKWEHKTHIGVYLGTAMRHSRKVSLIRSLKTGHVSPQFYNCRELSILAYYY